MQGRVTEPESLRQVFLRQVGVQPEAADVLGQLIREGHGQKASGKQIESHDQESSHSGRSLSVCLTPPPLQTTLEGCREKGSHRDL